MHLQYKLTPPDALYATVQLPASKSISNRALILNALSLSPYSIRNLSDCEDTQVIIDAFNSDSNVFDVKGAGTAMRFLTAFLAGMEGDWVIKGSKRMHERPIHPLVETLTALGANIEYLEKEGFPPLHIKGRKLKGGEVYLSGNISSQFISALLMIAPIMEKGLIMHIEKKIVSKPYIDLTIAMMAQCGVTVKWIGNDIVVRPQQYQSTELVVETDWSAASYWYEMVSMIPNSEVKLLGLIKNSLQGDSNVANLFSDLGVTTEFTEEGAVLRHTKRIPFLFSGIQSLKIKETDRVQALINELKKLGFVLKETEIGMLEWDGERCTPEKDPAIDTYDDHRMAMSLAPGALVFKTLNINNPEVVTKSYPHFWDDLKRAGFQIEER
jgi:3-phosphoshikimate 1-carboxyvinyltransferase